MFEEDFRGFVIGFVFLLMMTVMTIGGAFSAKSADLYYPPYGQEYSEEVEDSHGPFVYFGLNGNTLDGKSWGANVGVEMNERLRLELTYDRLNQNDLVMGNVILQDRLFFVFSPYLMAGVGYAFDTDEAVYNVGGGIRAALTEKIDLDVRYRHVFGVDDDILSVGLTARF